MHSTPPSSPSTSPPRPRRSERRITLGFRQGHIRPLCLSDVCGRGKRSKVCASRGSTDAHGQRGDRGAGHRDWRARGRGGGGGGGGGGRGGGGGGAAPSADARSVCTSSVRPLRPRGGGTASSTPSAARRDGGSAGAASSRMGMVSGASIVVGGRRADEAVAHKTKQNAEVRGKTPKWRCRAARQGERWSLAGSARRSRGQCSACAPVRPSRRRLRTKTVVAADVPIVKRLH